MLPEHAVLEGSVHFGIFFYFVYITELCKVFLEFHNYIHSFRFAQAQNVMKMFP